jgi:gluconate 2-dehydrogenase gamma chain
MTTHDATRRAFLVGAAIGAGAAVASGGIVPGAHATNDEAHSPSHTLGSAQPHSQGDRQGVFFNREEAATITAFTERLMPGAPGKPGAGDADVLHYIDLALSGAYAELQDFYRRGLAQLDDYCRNTFREPFRQLHAAQQSAVIAALEDATATGFTWPTAQQFFSIVRTHTMEGMFADPVYGGNRDFAGWRLVGFPGAQALFTPADMESKQAFAREPIIGLQSQAGSFLQGK